MIEVRRGPDQPILAPEKPGGRLAAGRVVSRGWNRFEGEPRMGTRMGTRMRRGATDCTDGTDGELVCGICVGLSREFLQIHERMRPRATYPYPTYHRYGLPSDESPCAGATAARFPASHCRCRDATACPQARARPPARPAPCHRVAARVGTPAPGDGAGQRLGGDRGGGPNLDTAQAAAIPWAEAGRAGGRATPGGDGLSISATQDGARLGCVFQRLEGEATPEGLWLTSTVERTEQNREPGCGTTSSPSPAPAVAGGTLSHRMGEGRGEGAV